MQSNRMAKLARREIGLTKGIALLRLASIRLMLRKLWTQGDIEDLKAALAHGDTIKQAAEFLCRAGSVDDVAAKARELGLSFKSE
jgi:hypothetical protein